MIEQLVSLALERQARFGQDDVARCAVEQARFQNRLQARYSLADLLLADIELGSRPPETQALCHGKKTSQMPKFDQRRTRSHCKINRFHPHRDARAPSMS